jgi:uncharacterized protein
MKNRIVFLLSTFAILFLPFAYAENNAAPGAAAQAGNAPQRGMLYRIRYHGNTTYLFGTIHVGVPDFFPLESEVTRALTRSSKLVLEIDVRKGELFQAALQKHGMYPGGETIERHLSSDSLLRLRQALQGFGIALENVAHLKPWLLTNMLIGLDLERHGYQRRHGIEFFLLSIADQQAKIVQELESADYQLSLFDGMADAMQERYLRENLAELDDGSALKKTRALVEAWAGAKGATLEDLVRESLKEKTSTSEFTQRVLLDQRNPEMANKIESLLKNEESTFVGVGLVHLIGENGVPGLLRLRGYDVERLY